MDSLFEIDQLQLYFGDPYVINDKIIIKQPNIVQIMEYGEKKYYSMVHTITAIPSDMKSQLADMGFDYEQLEDFQLFQMLAPTLSKESTSILFGDIDFTKLKPYRNPQNNLVVLADKETGLVIDVLIYERIVNYLRSVHGLKKKVEKAKNAMTKRILIEEDRRNLAMNKNKPYKSFLTPLVSAVKVRMGYTKDYVRNMGIYEFTDDIARLQIINNADALLRGIYGGMIDTKKIDKKELNWMKEIEH
jgi:predicted small metal-binding protein